MRLKRLFYAVVGSPPEDDAPKLTRLLWARRMYYRWSLPILVFVTIVAILSGMGGLWLLLIVVAGLVWLLGFVLVNFQILLEQRGTAPK